MKILRNLPVSRKLLFLLFFSGLTSFIIGLVGFLYVKEMANKSEIMYNDILMPNEWLAQIRIDNRAIDTYTLQLLLTKSTSENNELKQNIDSMIEEIIEITNQYKTVDLTSEEANTFQAYQEKIKELSDSRNHVLALAIENKNEDAYQLYVQEVSGKRAEVNELLSKLQQLNQDYANSINQQNKADIKTATIILLAVIILSLVVSSAIGLLIVRLITRPITDIKDLLSRAEEGDFTVKGSYESKDELGTLTMSFNNMIEGLRAIIEKVTETSQQVAAASEQLTASAEQTTSATEHVASTIQEIASGSEAATVRLEQNSNSLHEIFQGVLRISEGSTNVSELSKESAKEAEIGSEIVDRNLIQMGFIQESVSKSNEVIETLSHRSREIGKILEVISGIADQTNLLALNAAIEAARAGEHGKGFAVVADEVRKLAEQSQLAATDINHLLHRIQEDTKIANEMMTQGQSEASEGITVIRTAGSSFSEIVNHINKVSTQMQEVSATAEEMAASSEEMNAALNNIASISNEVAAETSQTATSAGDQVNKMSVVAKKASEMKTTVQELEVLVSHFKTNV